MEHSRDAWEWPYRGIPRGTWGCVVGGNPSSQARSGAGKRWGQAAPGEVLQDRVLRDVPSPPPCYRSQWCPHGYGAIVQPREPQAVGVELWEPRDVGQGETQLFPSDAAGPLTARSGGDIPA